MKLRGFLLFAALIGHAHAESVLCHVGYGGETRPFIAQPTTTPLVVPATPVGSYFRFRPVFEAGGAIKIYVYAERSGQTPRLLHQAVHAVPLPRGGPQGFTGLNRIYEPELDGELEYWCESR